MPETNIRIIVCVKQIRHAYARTGMDPEQGFLAPEDIINRVNPYDEVAMELALKSKEELGWGVISILTLGPIIAEADLRRCLAMGADHLYQIDTTGRMDSWCKSWLLAQAIRDIGGDLILCGKESLDNQNGQVGAIISHYLKMPFVSAITDLKILEEKRRANVQRRAGRGLREVLECPLPAVFSVDLGLHEPRLPTYEERKRALTYAIRKLRYEIGEVAPKTIAQKTYPPRPRPKRVPAPDSRLEAYERIQQLLSGTRIEKTAVMLEGSPESQADGIISFLKKHGFIPLDHSSKGR